MEKLLDRIVTIIFILALAAISFFVFKWVANDSTGSGEIGDAQHQDDNVFSDDEEFSEDATDNEDDEDYYDEDEAVVSDVPKEYEDEIASIMEDVTGGNAESSDDNSTTDTETSTDTNSPTTTDSSPKTTNTNSSPSTTTSSTEDAVAKSATEDNAKKTPKSSSSSAKYLLVAGSFTTRANAETQVKALKKDGYNPEIVNFNNSRMHTVLAGRYWSVTKAHEASDQLKLKKYECYVHTKR